MTEMWYVGPLDLDWLSLAVLTIRWESSISRPASIWESCIRNSVDTRNGYRIVRYSRTKGSSRQGWMESSVYGGRTPLWPTKSRSMSHPYLRLRLMIEESWSVLLTTLLWKSLILIGSILNQERSRLYRTSPVRALPSLTGDILCSARVTEEVI